MNAILLKWLQVQIALCIIGVCALAWLVIQYPSRLELKSRSDSDFAAAKSASNKITNLRKEVPNGRSQESSLKSIVSRVREGLQDSNIQEQRVGDIRIIGTTPIPKTSFAREDVSVGLKGIELPELFAFIQSQESQQGILCSGIDIRTSSTANEPSGKDKWDVDLTLTQVVEQLSQKTK